MRNNIILIIFTIFLLSSSVSALSPTEKLSVTPAPSEAKTESSLVEKEIQNLKEKIATKVAELRRKNLKAIAGIIIDNKKDSIQIKTENEQEYDIKIDKDLTKSYLISGTQKKDMKISDIAKGTYIVISGPTTDKEVSANVVYQDEQYLVKSGKVTEVNKDDESMNVLTSDKDKIVLDIETSTKLQMIDSKTLEIETIKFSKIKEGDTVHFVVKKTGQEKEENRFSAEKILMIPQEYFIK